MTAQGRHAASSSPTRRRGRGADRAPVARQTGASASALYGYAANKEEVVQLVLDWLFRYLADDAHELEAAPPGASEWFRDQFGGWLRSLPPDPGARWPAG